MPSSDPRDDLLRLRPYILPLRQAGALHMEDPALLAAIMLRESLAGWARGYAPAGSPDGSGDLIPRALREQTIARLGFSVKTVGTRVVGGEVRRVVLPADGRGWGRGLMQIDSVGPYRVHIPATSPWPVEDQLRTACLVLSDARAALRPWRGHARYDQAWVAAYNAGSPSVRRALEAEKDPDTYTSGANYGRDVWKRREALMKRAGAVFTLAPGGIA